MVTKVVRIGITGTHSTGKTTFLNSVEEALSKLGLRVGRVHDLARDAFARGFPILREQDYSGTLWLILQTMATELEVALKSDVVLVDRAAPDPLGYWMAALEHRGESPNTTHLLQIEQIIRFHCAGLDLLYMSVLDPALPLGSNQVRDGDLEFRAAVERHIAAALFRNEIKTIPIRNGEQTTALDLAVAYLSTKCMN